MTNIIRWSTSPFNHLLNVLRFSGKGASSGAVGNGILLLNVTRCWGNDSEKTGSGGGVCSDMIVDERTPVPSFKLRWSITWKRKYYNKTYNKVDVHRNPLQQFSLSCEHISNCLPDVTSDLQCKRVFKNKHIYRRNWIIGACSIISVYLF